MTYPAGVDPNFIIISRAPCEGREKRRQFIRKRVMLNYHAQRERQRNRTGKKVRERERKELGPGTQSASKAPLLGNQPSRRNTRSTGIPSTNCAILAAASPFVRPPSSMDLFKPRLFTNPQDRHLAGIIMRFLCGQVTECRRDIPAVGFIHGSAWALQSLVGPEKGNILTECRDLLRGCSTPEGRVDLASRMLWESISEKQESIYTTCARFCKWQLLSAIQAMSIFLLLRLSNGGNHPAFPDADIALLYSLGKIFKLLQDRYITRRDLHSPPTATLDEWQEWIFRESIIRTSMVYFILTLVVSMEFGLTCDHPGDWHLEEIPLPVGKAVWEATTKEEWDDAFGCQRMVAVLTFGDLASVCKDENIPGRESVRGKRIRDWQEEVDEFGLLVSIAPGLGVR